MSLDLTGFGSIADLIKTVLDRVVPDPTAKAAAALEVLKLQQAGEFKELDAQLAQMTAQTDINSKDAGNSNVFVSGWRPFIGWIGGVGLGYQWLVVPLTAYVYTLVTGHALPVTPPTMDPNLLLLIGSMLGVNIGARSVEKIKGVA